MGEYAKGTNVSSEKSRNEIERTLSRYGADQFAYGWDQNAALIQFRAHGRLIRFILDMPDRDSDEFWRTPKQRHKRSHDQAHAAWEQACRQRWRALVLIVKAKLEAVDAGIVAFEEEFLAQVVLPDGSTVGDFMGPQIEAAYETGTMPNALPQLEAQR